MPHLAIGPAMLISGLIGAGGSVASSALGRRSSSQTTSPQRDSQQLAVQAQLAEILKNSLATGPTVPGYERNAGRTAINEGYNSILPRVESQLAARGFGTSGKVGSTVRDVEIGRANEMSKLEGDLHAKADERFRQMLQLAMAFQNPLGSTTTSTEPSPWPGAVSGITGDLSSMLMLYRLLQPGGGGVNPAMSPAGR